MRDAPKSKGSKGTRMEHLSTATTPTGMDAGTKALIYGALACGLTYVGLVFGILGILSARKQRAVAPNKNARIGLVLSVVGVCIQLALVVAAALVIALGR
jgi:hypothetical protein